MVRRSRQPTVRASPAETLVVTALPVSLCHWCLHKRRRITHTVFSSSDLPRSQITADSSNLPVHYPNAYDGWPQTKVSHLDGRDPGPQTIARCLPGSALAGSWNRKPEARTEPRHFDVDQHLNQFQTARPNSRPRSVP